MIGGWSFAGMASSLGGDATPAFGDDPSQCWRIAAMESLSHFIGGADHDVVSSCNRRDEFVCQAQATLKRTIAVAPGHDVRVIVENKRETFGALRCRQVKVREISKKNDALTPAALDLKN